MRAVDARSRLVASAVSIALGFASAGCYLAHEPAEPSDRACLAAPGEACGALVEAPPDVVCRMPDGQVIVHKARTSLASCAPNEARPGTFRLVINHCLGEQPFAQAIACEGAPASGPITIGERTFDPAPGHCELQLLEEPAGPYRPFDEADELCVELPASCGAPLVVELVQRGADGCGGAGTAERCRVDIDGSRIVLHAETAPARGDACLPVVGDRVARCAVRPLAPGRYELATPDGRVHDVVESARPDLGAAPTRRGVPLAR